MTHQTPLKRQASSEELDEGTRSRIRAEEVFRLQIRDTIAPPQSKSLLDKMAALLNTHVGVGTIGAVILAVATWSYTHIDNYLHRAEREAEKERVRALADVQNVSPFLPMLAKEGSPERTLACRILAHMIMSKAINETLGTGLAREAGNCFKASLDKSEASQAAGEAIAEELRSPTQLTESLPESASEPSNAMPSPAQFALARAMPKRIYIQYANKEQTTSLDGLRTICRDKGWIVPQAENVGSRAPNKLQVRYFNDDDAEVAQKVFDLLTQTPPFNSMPRDEKPSKLSLKAPPGQVEIWLPRS